MSDIGRAIWFANNAHDHQKDKSGRPFILHPLRVMLSMDINDEVGQVVSVLHDVVEDTPRSLKDVQDVVGLSTEEVDALDAITRRVGEQYKVYIRRCVQNDIARRVKIADLQDNLDPRRSYPGSSSIVNRYIDALQFIKLGVWT